jgi:outer membrane biogenesis lipoprotein LolB
MEMRTVIILGMALLVFTGCTKSATAPTAEVKNEPIMVKMEIVDLDGKTEESKTVLAQ